MFHHMRLRWTSLDIRLLLAMIGIACTVLTPISMSLHAHAGPDDIDALIDDSGPLPKDGRELMRIPDLLFTTSSGLVCKKSRGKIIHDVTCTGGLPGAPAGTRVVNLSAAYAQADGPARFLPTPAEGFFGDITGQVPVLLPAGHKIVFWAISNTQSLVCGVPPSAALVCELKADGTIGPNSGGPETHGFVISAAQSRVY